MGPHIHRQLSSTFKICWLYKGCVSFLLNQDWLAVILVSHWVSYDLKWQVRLSQGWQVRIREQWRVCNACLQTGRTGHLSLLCQQNNQADIVSQSAGIQSIFSYIPTPSGTCLRRLGEATFGHVALWGSCRAMYIWHSYLGNAHLWI
jgi:hypothetical protein